MVFLGFVACRLALRPHKPLARYTWLILAYLVLGFSASPFMGPLYGNNTPEVVQATAASPVLAPQPAAQHTFRIYITRNLDRTNPAFVPLAALWVGAALAVVRKMVGARVLLAAALLFSVISWLSDRGDARYLDRYLVVSSDPASWLPLPILPAALLLLFLFRYPSTQRWAWALTGGILGSLTFLVWGRQPWGALLIPLAAPAMVVGSRLGNWIHRVLQNPSLGKLKWLVPLAGVGMPILVGLLDLYLRRLTP